MTGASACGTVGTEVAVCALYAYDYFGIASCVRAVISWRAWLTISGSLSANHLGELSCIAFDPISLAVRAVE